MFNRHVASDEKFEEHSMTLHWSMIGYPVDMQVRPNLSSSIIYPLGKIRVPVNKFYRKNILLLAYM